jgi:uncharacterized membrane protein
MSEQTQQVSESGVQCAADSERIPSTIALFGHPLHPMLIHFPIAFFLGTVLTDAAFWWTGDVFWPRMSFWLLAAGLAGGAVAALFGMADFMLVPQIRAHITSWNHFIVAILAMSIGAANFVMRWDDAVAGVLPWGIFMSGMNVVVLGIAASLGGHLVYKHLVGTGTHL